MIGGRLGRYEILAKLGEGGMGVVYQAHDAVLDRIVAIKLLPSESVADPDRKRRFTLEAQAASALNHPGVLTIHDITSERLRPAFGDEEGPALDFIAMEYVDGKTLSELIGPKGLRLKDVLSYATQAASALAKAHAAGIVHRDLKPSNIMVTDDGLVKILDFGVAKLTTSNEVADQEAATQTRTARDRLETVAGKIVGTVAYMSPEQAEGKKVDARSDIFSFGSVLYEMATGTRAFQAASSTRTLSAVLNEEPKRPSQLAADLPHEMERVILRCLRKDPAKRFQHMADLAVELEEIKTESGTQVDAAQKPVRRFGKRWLIASTAIVSAAAVTAWVLWLKASAAGPPPVVGPLTSLHGDEQLPALSPDGNQVAFTWDGEKRDNLDVYVMPVGAATPLRLTTDPAEDTTPAWSPDGSQIAFLRRLGRKTTLYLTRPVPGDERKVTDIDDVVVRNGGASVSWFPDSKRLVISDSNGTVNGIVVIPVDRGEQKRLISTPASAGEYHWPSVSPTASLLAYSRCASESSFVCDVYVTELAQDLTVKGTPRQLTQHHSTVYGIAWSADGRSLVYGSGAYTTYLWRISAAGGQPDRLELAGDRAGFPAISGASSRLAYTRFNGDADIWKLDAENGPPQTFLSSTLLDLHPQFSPDGKRIAFESNRLGKDSQIWVANSDGTNAAPLNDGARGVHGSPRWSPDGRSITHDGQGEDGRQSVYVVDAAGGQPRLLTSPGTMPSFSRDGNWIYFSSRRTNRSEIWRIPATGGDAVQVSDTGGSNVQDSPDGKTIYYKRDVRGESAVLFAKPVGGGPARQILDSMLSGFHKYVPADDGIYYISVYDPMRPGVSEVRFLNFATGKHDTLHRVEALWVASLAVSPDRKTILVSGFPISKGNDLMLIRNFR